MVGGGAQMAWVGVCYEEGDDENDILTQQQDFASHVSDLVNQLKYSAVIGNSCGLWCIHGYKNWPTEMVVIWNPTIRKSVGIVMPRLLSKTIGKMTYIGFGVCPSTYDPTIVVISMCFQRKNKHNITWQVGIFTLSSKTWKMIPSSNVPRKSIRLMPSTQVATDRFIFWVAYERIATNDKSFIFSFDLITHEFKEVNRHSLKNYGVWIMGEEGGVMTSFTKLFTINTPYVCKLLGFRISGEPIMETVTVTGDRPLTKIKVGIACIVVQFGRTLNWAKHSCLYFTSNISHTL
ncbi:reverse transcriptase domain-containing protein [Tanacetum coccineum]|uniref:Reverse transcriptase domain-containing protein n=1 Tax=Tanacetum coccineum TaxID=301880 RepID=A0ABQ5E8X8_9ASTR